MQMMFGLPVRIRCPPVEASICTEEELAEAAAAAAAARRFAFRYWSSSWSAALASIEY